MELLATPEDRFDELPNFPYEPQYVDVGGPRMAYVEAGAGEETFLCLHGEPTWSFLYRDVIPPLAEAGRVVAPDLVGFGRSDKYDDRDAYTFTNHYEWLTTFVERLDLRNVTLVCHDWGGVLGLPAAVLEFPERISRLVPMNTGLPVAAEMIDAWWAFRDYMWETRDPPISTVVSALGDMASYHDLDEQPTPWTAPVESGDAGLPLDDAVARAYDAPFQTADSKAGARAFPSLVPTDAEMEGVDVGRAAIAALSEWEKPTFVLYGDDDPITGVARDALRNRIPGADAGPDVWVEGAGHFLQEQRGAEIGRRIAAFARDT
jgi:haloalkane dehalogenase